MLKISCNYSDGKTLSQQINLQFHQKLDGHNGIVISVDWNRYYGKLASTDDTGETILWNWFDKKLFAERRKKTKKRKVKKLKWNNDGNYLCLLYEDGKVLLMSKEGNKVWSRTLEKSTCFCWTSFGEILFGSANGILSSSSLDGMKKVEHPKKRNSRIVSVEWLVSIFLFASLHYKSNMKN